MSTDEIRGLAERCKADARRLGGCAGTANFEEDEYHYKFYKDASDAELAKASALLACAAMVERCYDARAKIAKHNNVFREVWGHDDVFDGNKLIDYILKGATDERK